MIAMPMRIPSKIYYCKRHGTIKDKPGECYWYRKTRCLAGGRCDAIVLYTMNGTIKPRLILEIESLLERYEDASPPMDRTRFVVELIEKARGL